MRHVRLIALSINASVLAFSLPILRAETAALKLIASNGISSLAIPSCEEYWMLRFSFVFDISMLLICFAHAEDSGLIIGEHMGHTITWD